MGTSNEEAVPADLDLRSDCASLNKPFQEMHFTPRKNAHTPMKTLPFSPSQVYFCCVYSNLQPNFKMFLCIVFEQFCVNPHGSHHVNACLCLSAQTICALDPSDPWRMRYCRLCCTTNSTSWKSRTHHSNPHSLQRRFGRNGEKGWTYQLYCKFRKYILPYFN